VVVEAETIIGGGRTPRKGAERKPTDAGRSFDTQASGSPLRASGHAGTRSGPLLVREGDSEVERCEAAAPPLQLSVHYVNAS